MEFGICPLSVIPLRSEPKDSSEQISQILFGETFSILSKTEKWLQVRLSYDDYEGWIDAKQFKSIDTKHFEEISSLQHAMVFDLSCPSTVGHDRVPLLMGAVLYDFDGMHFRHGKKKGFFNGQVVRPGENGLGVDVIEKVAMRYLNTPYLWGGRGPFGIDCSGFSQMVFKFLGIPLRRDAYQQAEQGKTVAWLNEARKGDLAFFANEQGRINHVGVLLDSEKIIHASGKVRIDRMDNYGIFMEEKKSYSHKLKVIKRIAH